MRRRSSGFGRRGLSAAGGLPKHEVVPEFLSIHGRMLELVVEANGLDLAAIKVRSPAGPVKFGLGQRIALLDKHDRRHFWQAWAVGKIETFLCKNLATDGHG